MSAALATLGRMPCDGRRQGAFKHCLGVSWWETCGDVMWRKYHGYTGFLKVEHVKDLKIWRNRMCLGAEASAMLVISFHKHALEVKHLAGPNNNIIIKAVV